MVAHQRGFDAISINHMAGISHNLNAHVVTRVSARECASRTSTMPTQTTVLGNVEFAHTVPGLLYGADPLKLSARAITVSTVAPTALSWHTCETQASCVQ